MIWLSWFPAISGLELNYWQSKESYKGHPVLKNLIEKDQFCAINQEF